MTTEQQNIAIAEACGWKCEVESCRSSDRRSWSHPDLPNHCLHKLPNYTSDLNAMHEAEKMFWPVGCVKWNKYIDRLLEVTCDCEESPVNATAHQRAEAFLRTIGKRIE